MQHWRRSHPRRTRIPTRLGRQGRQPERNEWLRSDQNYLQGSSVRSRCRHQRRRPRRQELSPPRGRGLRRRTIPKQTSSRAITWNTLRLAATPRGMTARRSAIVATDIKPIRRILPVQPDTGLRHPLTFYAETFRIRRSPFWTGAANGNKKSAARTISPLCNYSPSPVRSGVKK